MSSQTGTVGFHLHAGDRIGRYVIMSELGRGGMAVVYKAHQPDLDRVVALKVISNMAVDKRFVERFQAEARAVAKISHPHVIKIHEVGEADGIHYLAMEYVQGLDLGVFLNKKKPNLFDVVEIVRQICDALAFCHKQGIIHRDLKPSNILIHNNTPIVIDFGLAKTVETGLNPTITLSGEVVGSPAYMSPEQAMGHNVGVLSDICSFGIIIYELISFKNPYLDPRSVHQTALNAIRAEPIPLRYLCPWLDKDFSAIVHMALAKEEKDRYQSMELLLRDIIAYQQGEPVLAKPPSVFNLGWRFFKNNPALYWVLLLMLVVGTMIAGFIIIQEENRIAPWGHLETLRFNEPKSTKQFLFQSYKDEKWNTSTEWYLKNGRLEVASSGLSAAISKNDYFGDLKMEFWVSGLEGSNSDFCAFMYGANPESGFRFCLGEWGSLNPSIESGAFGTLNLPFKPVKLNGGVNYKVTVAKDGDELYITLNDEIVAKKRYTLPIRVGRASRVGLFTCNSKMAIDSLRIFKRGIALSANPTVVADAYLEEGFIQNSILSYQHVIETYPNRSVGFEAQLKLGLCYMALGDNQSALQHLMAAAGHSRDSRIVPSALYHLSECLDQLNRHRESFEKLSLIPQIYPNSEFNEILIDTRLERIYDCLNQEQNPEKCADRLVEEMRFLIEHEDSHRNKFGPSFAKLVETFRIRGINEPVKYSLGLSNYFSAETDTYVSLLLTQAKYFLGLNQISKARELLQSAGSVTTGTELQGQVELWLGIASFLSNQFEAAGIYYEQAYQNYESQAGMAFPLLLHTQLLGTLGQRKSLTIHPSVYANARISKLQRQCLALLDEKISYAEFLKQQKSISMTMRSPSLEEVLAPFIYLHNHRGTASASEYFQGPMNSFARGTVENVFLKHLLQIYRQRFAPKAG